MAKRGGVIKIGDRSSAASEYAHQAGTLANNFRVVRAQAIGMTNGAALLKPNLTLSGITYGGILSGRVISGSPDREGADDQRAREFSEV